MGISRFLVSSSYEGTILALKELPSKIIHDTDRGDRHSERHYNFLFWVRAGGSAEKGEKIEKDTERSALFGG